MSSKRFKKLPEKTSELSSEVIEKLLEIMRQLRDPEQGCEWDKNQTFKSLIPYLKEESAEVTSIARLEELSPAQIVQNFEKSQLKDDVPPFRPGESVVVSVKVKEGERTRLQAFEGVVMHIKNAGLNSSFIVRKISSGIGVERTFQVHSPLIDSIKVKRKGDVRKAKLYYLRERSGRSARIKERLE